MGMTRKSSCGRLSRVRPRQSERAEWTMQQDPHVFAQSTRWTRRIVAMAPSRLIIPIMPYLVKSLVQPAYGRRLFVLAVECVTASVGHGISPMIRARHLFPRATDNSAARASMTSEWTPPS